MPSTSATTSTTSKTAAAVPVELRETIPIPIKVVASDMSNEEDLLKEYSKELYVYTLDMLNSVRIDAAHKGLGGKAYAFKRTISDIAVPLKTMAISDVVKPTAKVA